MDAATSIGRPPSINRANEPFPREGKSRKDRLHFLASRFVTYHAPSNRYTERSTLSSAGGEMCGSCSPLQPFLLSHTALLPPKHRGLSLQNLSLHLVNPVSPITGGEGGNLTKYVIHIRLLHLGLYLLLTSQIEMLPTSLAKSCHLQCPSPASFF